MRKVDKDHNDPPKSLKSKKCREHTRKLLEDNPERQFNDYYYKQPRVKKKLEELYHCKCAYCEINAKIGGSAEIDHYRPTKEVKGKPHHPGYYWLFSEWSNLLYTCKKCNGSKGASFPLESEIKRVPAPPLTPDGDLIEKRCQAKLKPLIDEDPLLLHPEINDPVEHLIFLPDGTLKGKTNRGNKTIEICQLNREELVLERRKIIEHFRMQIEKMLDFLADFKQSKEAIERLFIILLIEPILCRGKPSQQYSMLGWFMFEKFELFFIEHLTTLITDEEVINQLKKVYESFKQNPREYPACSEYHADVE